MSKTTANDDLGTPSDSVLDLTSAIVAAYVAKNPVPAAEIPNVIRAVQSTLNGLAHSDQVGGSSTAKPAVPIKKSITADYIVCLEDGKKLKMLKRYLRSRYDLTPDAYRQRWGLPIDYPMVAPNYSATRSEFAKKSGLGRRKDAPNKRRKR